MLQFHILTLFPDYFKIPLSQGIIGRAQSKKLIQCQVINIRDFAEGERQNVDDRPFGGGDGMVLSYPSLSRSLLSIKNKGEVLYLSPQGKKWNHEWAKEKAQSKKPLTLVCGRYAGVDARWIHQYVDEEVSIGDYVLSGGELGALVIVDSTSRYIHGVLGHPDSVWNETFENNFLFESPQWTRPRDIGGYSIPKVFLAGNHEDIREKRYFLSLLRTQTLRPDLIKISKYKEDLEKAKKWFDSLSEEEKKACLI